MVKELRHIFIKCLKNLLLNAETVKDKILVRSHLKKSKTQKEEKKTKTKKKQKTKKQKTKQTNKLTLQSATENYD